MKRLLIIGLILLFSGCATFKEIKESEWAKHDSQYASFEHMKFSLWGYKNPTWQILRTSGREQWWGEAIVFDPDKEINDLLVK